MSTIRRVVIAGALALPLTLGAAGVASADTWAGHSTLVGPNGAASHSVVASANDWGASYHETTTAVGPRGVYSDRVSAGADNWGNGSYDRSTKMVSSRGVATNSTHATIGDNDWDYGNANHHQRRG